MDLNDWKQFSKIDTQNMLAEIDHLPDQLLEAMELGDKHSIEGIKPPKAMILAGMGGSAMGGDLFSTYIEDLSPVQLFVHRNYGLPKWVQGRECLVIVSSHSGSTEETLSAFNTALERDCQILALTTGGQLAQTAMNNRVPTWTFEHHGQPRAAIGFSFGLLMQIATKLGLISDNTSELKDTVREMKLQQSSIDSQVPILKNPAKRMAGQMVGRIVSVYGADHLAPVARRWKTQINELAKTWSQFEYLPEANHNAIAGASFPVRGLDDLFVLFLKSRLQNPRNLMRTELNKESFMTEGINTDSLEAKGSTRLAQIWTSLHFGDYVSYYLAMLNEINPTPIETITWLKNKLGKAE